MEAALLITVIQITFSIGLFLIRLAFKLLVLVIKGLWLLLKGLGHLLIWAFSKPEKDSKINENWNVEDLQNEY
jgi:hypothetical protein